MNLNSQTLIKLMKTCEPYHSSASEISLS